MTVDELKTAAGKAWLVEQYVEQKKSTYAIAKELGTYANMIRRAMLHHRLPLRDKQDGTLEALKSGRLKHPFFGESYRPSDVKKKIGGTVARRWRDTTQEERARRAREARQRWLAMPSEDKERILTLAAQGVRRAGVDGSKLELYLVKKLEEDGLKPRLRPRMPNVDILLEDERVAIDILGPGYHLPIWGEEQMNKNMAANDLKCQKLLTEGYRVIRIKNIARHLSGHRMGVVYRRLREAMTLDRPACRELAVIELEVS